MGKSMRFELRHVDYIIDIKRTLGKYQCSYNDAPAETAVSLSRLCPRPQSSDR